MIDPALQQGLRVFDDDALATLANPGLVRRAHRDIEDGKVRAVASSAGTATIEADGQTVTLDTRGPRTADCTCGSAAICRHRIAAVLLLRDVQRAEPVDTTVREPAEIVLTLDLAALERWAGKASWRAAVELASTATLIEPSPDAIAVSFADSDDVVRILRGQGFDGIASKIAKGKAKAYHAAAVLAARQHFGAAAPQPAPEDDAAPAAVEVDQAFLDRVAGALCEVAALGFNLAPLPLEESLFELSVSSRADSQPRLAAMLRSIAAQVRLRRQRALAFDPDLTLELAATSFALTRALTGSDPERATHLAGKLRRDFTPTDPLELIGCGGERWTSSTGARGVTAWFMEAESGRWVSTTLARGAGQDPDFRPLTAWQAQSMWGAEPLAVLSHARIRLDGARRSADDRLSAPAEARATILARGVAPDPSWPGVVRQWQHLPAAWRTQTGLGLEATTAPAVCLVTPVAIGSPSFDDLEQQIVWPVQDVTGAWLGLTLDHSEQGDAAIDALEANVRRDWRGTVLIRMTRVGDRLQASPITLFGSGGPIDVAFWSGRRSTPSRIGSGLVANWLERLRSDSRRRFSWRAGTNTEIILAAAWRQLLDRVGGGAAFGQSVHQAQGRLIAEANRLDDHGLHALGALMRKADHAPDLLAAAYGLLVARQQRSRVPLLQMR